VAYTVIFPPPTSNYTEFYILGADDKAGNYPTNLTVGETGNITIGVVNHEHQTVNYILRIDQDGKSIDEKNLTIKNGEKLLIPFNFTATTNGMGKIEFNLYKLPDQKNIYRSLYLQINVKQ
jgi:uncharacterized membrane protein